MYCSMCKTLLVHSISVIPYNIAFYYAILNEARVKILLGTFIRSHAIEVWPQLSKYRTILLCCVQWVVKDVKIIQKQTRDIILTYLQTIELSNYRCFKSPPPLKVVWRGDFRYLNIWSKVPKIMTDRPAVPYRIFLTWENCLNIAFWLPFCNKYVTIVTLYNLIRVSPF